MGGPLSKKRKTPRRKSQQKLAGLGVDLLSPIERLTVIPPDGITLVTATKTDWAEGRSAEEQRIGVEKERRLVLLAVAFGFDPEDESTWRGLALRLAEHCVPGFQVIDPPSKPGRPIGTFLIDPNKLLGDLQGLIEGGMTISSACAHLSRKEPWGSYSKMSLERAYRTAVKDRGKRRRERDQELEQVLKTVSFGMSLTQRNKSRGK